MAIRTRLLHDTPDLAVIAALGYDELRFHAPVRAGDTLQLRQEWLDKRVSDSKPDRGVARSRLSLVNQDGVEVMSHIDTILVRRRNRQRLIPILAMCRHSVIGPHRLPHVAQPSSGESRPIPARRKARFELSPQRWRGGDVSARSCRSGSRLAAF
jgi:hypothetical protein